MTRITTSTTAPESSARRLPVGYYLDNLEAVLATVKERYGDLLRDDERAFVGDFRALPVAPRRLWARLIARRGPLFRRDRLAYPEIPDLEDAAERLVAAGFADRAEDASPAALLALLLARELTALEGELLGGAPPARKGERIERLLAASSSEDLSPEDLSRAIRSRVEPLRPRRLRHLPLFRLLFFGNLYQDWSVFVLRDLGAVRYEPYPLERRLRRFPSRRAIDDAVELSLRRLAVGETLERGDLEDALELAAPVIAGEREWHAVARPLLDRIANAVGQALERAGRGDEALVYYERASAPPARERRVRILARQGWVGRAIRLCRELEAEPRDEAERRFAPRFIHRLRRRCGDRVAPLPRPRRPLRELALPVPDEGGKGVERRVLERLAVDGREGVFAENWLWKSLFGLAFWDEIFAPIPGVFEHPFQHGPLDLMTPVFRPARAALIERRLAALEAASPAALRAELLARYDRKEGVANALVSWHPAARPALELALRRLDGPRLARVCDRLSRDPGRYRRGLPDLFVVRRRDPGFVLYEVKSPGDQLRPEQKGWIDYLNRVGLPARVLRVRFGDGG